MRDCKWQQLLVGLGGKEISVRASVTCTFGQKRYQEFDSPRARWGKQDGLWAWESPGTEGG